MQLIAVRALTPSKQTEPSCLPAMAATAARKWAGRASSCAAAASPSDRPLAPRVSQEACQRRRGRATLTIAGENSLFDELSTPSTSGFDTGTGPGDLVKGDGDMLRRRSPVLSTCYPLRDGAKRPITSYWTTEWLKYASQAGNKSATLMQSHEKPL